MNDCLLQFGLAELMTVRSTYLCSDTPRDNTSANVRKIDFFLTRYAFKMLLLESGGDKEQAAESLYTPENATR